MDDPPWNRWIWFVAITRPTRPLTFQGLIRRLNLLGGPGLKLLILLVQRRIYNVLHTQHYEIYHANTPLNSPLPSDVTV